MEHTVEIIKKDVTVAIYNGLTKIKAIKTAKKERNENNQVYISGYNGQCTVYLNPDGNYEPTGKSW